MIDVGLETQHAPAERAGSETLAQQAERVQQAPLLRHLADAIPDILVILNRQRQIVYANQRLVEFLNLQGGQELIGLRPGEALNCAHASQSAAGCGTTEFCRTCGAVNAILASQKGLQSVQECRILTQDKDALDLKVWATPYQQDGQRYTVFVAADVSDEKRRQTLERVFFHDVLNTAGGVYGLSALLAEEDDLDQVPDIAEMIYRSSDRLIKEIQAQRQLSAAERGDLAVSISDTRTVALLSQVAESYGQHPVAENRVIEVDEGAHDVALEATSPGDAVRLTCTAREASVVFGVHNAAYMPRNVQLQVFKRSFSTKGVGRGIGTYSIKLFGEKYLGGSVWFHSTEQEGTTFFLMLPKSAQPPQ